MPRSLLLTQLSVNDATILIRDIAGDAATNAASRLKPSSDDLARIDAPAADNVWHDAPDFSKDNLKKQIQGVYKGEPKEDAQAAVAAGTSSAHPTGSADPNSLGTVAGHDQQTGTSSGIDTLGGVSAAANTAIQRADANLDEEAKEKARTRAQELRAKAKEYLSKKMPEERRDQTIWRLKVSLLSPSTRVVLTKQ